MMQRLHSGEDNGNILSGWNLNIVEAFGTGLGDMLTQLVKIFIQTGIEVAGLQKAALALSADQCGAVIVIAAGIAAVAAGQFLKKSFKDVQPRRLNSDDLTVLRTDALPTELPGFRIFNQCCDSSSAFPTFDFTHAGAADFLSPKNS
ncbi:hypothetical protein ACX0G7_25490 [Flavitalea antarctica]